MNMESNIIGSQPGFDMHQLLADYDAMIWKFVHKFKLSIKGHEPEDIYNEIVVALLTKLSSHQQRPSSSYVYKTIRSSCIDLTGRALPIPSEELTYFELQETYPMTEVGHAVVKDSLLQGDPTRYLAIWDIENRLKGRELRIFTMRCQGYTLKEIGDELGVTESCVSKIIKKKILPVVKAATNE